MSTIKVNTVTKRTGSTLTLGESGTTVTLACGATQTGFGRTGTVDWCTTAKTSPFTSVSGKGYFVNTTSGAVTVTLPASPSAGDIVSIADYTNTFQTNKVTLARNGSKIGGVCANASLSTEGQSATFVYVDGTEGWKNVQDSTSNVVGVSFISASGGTETTSPCGNFKIHTFNATGCFSVSSLSSVPANNEVSYIVVGGGGGAGSSSGNSGGGGGAGGFRESKSGVDTYTASPLEGATNITVTATTFPITVGGGGAGSPGSESPGTVGSNSVFSTVTSAGGGFGGGPAGPPLCGGAGGSGGGGSGGGFNRPGGSGNTPPVTPPQGRDGGSSPAGPTGDQHGGGGGGAGAVGQTASPSSGGGNGGDGVATSITGSSVTRAGGGGGGWYQPTAPSGSGGTGGAGGGGTAGTPAAPNACSAGQNGTDNTGGGGGAPNSSNSFAGGTGGSGVVIIRYKFQ